MKPDTTTLFTGFFSKSEQRGGFLPDSGRNFHLLRVFFPTIYCCKLDIARNSIYTCICLFCILSFRNIVLDFKVVEIVSNLMLSALSLFWPSRPLWVIFLGLFILLSFQAGRTQSQHWCIWNSEKIGQTLAVTYPY